MPLYDYVCACGKTVEAYSSIKDRRKGPICCEKRMKISITGTHYVIGAFKGYRAIGRGRPFIKTRQQHRDYLRENGYEEVGNDASAAPPDLKMTPQEVEADRADKMREIRQSFSETERIREELAHSPTV